MAAGLHNDLESVTKTAHPVIGELKEALTLQGALGVQMSGSGPTVFGIFENESSCRVAAHNLSDKGWLLYPVAALTESPIAEHLAGRRAS
jgi:4-diphosphocytidyl-2-C-methyl-D-erythritol kinase